MNKKEIMKILEDFAEKHHITLKTRGELGFCRGCVGFIKDGKYIHCTPIKFNGKYAFPDAKIIYCPQNVRDVYHTHDCLCVLVYDNDYDEALRQLALFVLHLEKIGVELKYFDKGSIGSQAFFVGSRHAYAFVPIERNI